MRCPLPCLFWAAPGAVFPQSRIKPIEIEIIFEEELPELEASALLEDLDMLVEDESEQTPVAEEDLPILEPAPPADFDPLFSAGFLRV